MFLSLVEATRKIICFCDFAGIDYTGDSELAQATQELGEVIAKMLETSGNSQMVAPIMKYLVTGKEE